MSDTDWWFVDLAAAVAVTGVCTYGLFADPPGAVRPLVAMPLVLFLPGYALVSVLFPDASSGEYSPFDAEKRGLRNPLLVEGGLEATERFVLSVVLSVALVPAITLFATVSPWGVTTFPILAGIALVTLALSLLAIVVRSRCPPERRFAPSLPARLLPFTRRRPGPYESSARPYNLALVLAVLVLVASAGFALANPPESDGFTEFYVETDEVTGETETMYDATFAVGESRTLPIAVANHEGEETAYTTVIVLQEVSYDGDDATVHEETELQRTAATVPDGETHREDLAVEPSPSGEDHRLALLLYRGEAPDEPSADDAYRAIHLPIEFE